MQLAVPVTMLGGMEEEKRVNVYLYESQWITIVKPIVWTLAFIPAYGMRGAGDVRFSMVLSCLSMWFCRSCALYCFNQNFHFGPIGVWIGMFADWTIRAVLFTVRFFQRKMAGIKV